MSILAMISQALLYLCFSIIVGSFILLLVPNKYHPDLKISKLFLLISAITLPILAFIPVLENILYISPRLGFVESLKIVLLTYTAGNAWMFTLLGSAVLISLISLRNFTQKDTYIFLGTFITFLLILTIAWSSHVGAMNPVIGIISDFIHLSAVSIWIGILLIISWCSTNQNNWLKFLKWFSIVAISCLTATAISGFLLMNVLVNGYIHSWIVSYGQGLLLKHLFLLPVIFYALANSIIVKFELPPPSLRLEVGDS